MRRFHTALRIKQAGLLVMILFLSVGTTAHAVILSDQLQSRSGKESRYVSGRIIVKLTPQAANQMPLDEQIPVDRVPIPALKDVSQRYQVAYWKRMFPRVSGSDPSGLGRIYAVVSDPSVDVLRAIQSFKDLSQDVEYAQPDRVYQVQRM